MAPLIYAALQLLSILAVGGLFLYCPQLGCWYPIFLSLAFTHYLLAIIYSRKQLESIFRHKETWLPLGIVAAVGITLYAYELPLYLYFALHHAFNETYMPFRRYPGSGSMNERNWRLAGVTVHVSAIVLMVNARSLLDTPGLLLALLGILVSAYVVHMAHLCRARHRLSVAGFSSLCLLESLLLVLVPLSFFYPINIYHIVFYHVIYWAFIPLVGMYNRGNTAGSASYIGATLVSVLGFLLVIPEVMSRGIISTQDLNQQFIVWSFVHITLSFATSRAQPALITQWFLGREEVPVVRSGS